MTDNTHYNNQFNNWLSNEKTAVNLLNYSGQLMYDKGIEIGKDYALPIIDNKLETKNAKDKIWKVKTSSQSKILARDVLRKHTSSTPNKFKVA